MPRPALPLAEQLEGVAEVVLGHRPVERRVLALPVVQDELPGLDGLFQSGIVAALVSLPIKRVSLAVKAIRGCVRMPRRDQIRGLLELLCSVGVAQLGQGDAAAAGEQLCGIQGMTVFGRLRILRELARLPEGRELGLLGLVEEIVGFGQPPGVERGFRRARQFGRVRIIRLECRQLVAGLREMGRDLGQPYRDLLFRHILFAQDSEKLGDRTRREPQLLRQLRSLGFGLMAMLFRHVLIAQRFGQQGEGGRIFLIDRFFDDVDRAVLDVAPYGHTAWSRNGRLPRAWIGHGGGDDKTQCRNCGTSSRDHRRMIFRLRPAVVDRQKVGVGQPSLASAQACRSEWSTSAHHGVEASAHGALNAQLIAHTGNFGPQPFDLPAEQFESYSRARTASQIGIALPTRETPEINISQALRPFDEDG